MLFLIAFVGAAVIALVLWRATNAARGEFPPRPGAQAGSSQPFSSRLGSSPTGPPQAAPRARISGPDDDPEFLRQLDEKVRRRDEPPA